MTRLKINKQYIKKEFTCIESDKELKRWLELLNWIDKKIITFFGWHRVKKDSIYYKSCKELAYKLWKKDYAILSWGWPWIMHASNSWATQAKTISIWTRAELLTKERIYDNIFTHTLDFKFLFTRRFIMSVKSEALIFYPWWYWTLNELFEYAVLMQTGITDKVPIICVYKDFWKWLFEWLENNPLREDFLINNISDLDLIHFIDSEDEIIDIIWKY